MLSAPWFGQGKQLVLVRSERRPLGEDERNFFGEMRRSAPVDAVVAKSEGRIVIAAPYFVQGSDRYVRDWELFRLVCERSPGHGNLGALRIVPSVQLLTTVGAAQENAALSSALGRSLTLIPGEPVPCTPFPAQGPAMVDDVTAHLRQCDMNLTIEVHRAVKSRECAAAQAECAALPPAASAPMREACSLLKQRYSRLAQSGSLGIPQLYWSVVQQAVKPRHVLADLPGHDSVGNRIVFRHAPDRMDQVVPRHLDLPGQEALFDQRTVVIGQVHKESGDFFETPLGRMAGAQLLVNAIDSMAVHKLLKPPGDALTLSVAGVLIVVVGYLFARWSSAVARLLATTMVIVTAGAASFFLFAHGIWLDFAAPIIGIQIHAWWASVEERHRLAVLEREHGVAH